MLQLLVVNTNFCGYQQVSVEYLKLTCNMATGGSSSLQDTDFYVMVDCERPLESLPTFILLHIVSFLPIEALLALQFCSKRSVAMC